MPLIASRLLSLGHSLGAPWRAASSHLDRWLFQLGGPAASSVTLVQRRIFILPSRHGLMFAGALALMLTGSINYNLSLGFILTFLLAALGINAILYTFRNLAGLRVSSGRVSPVFAGDTARFALNIDNPGMLERFAIGISRDKSAATYTDVPARQSITVEVPLPATRRGVLRPGRLTLFTQFPLGLCHGWAYAELDMQCIVYPQPEGGRVPLPRADMHEGSGIDHGAGQEDFAGLRSYFPGDSPRHIAWKAAARGDALLTKQFSGRAASELWLDWAVTPDTLSTEARLSRLARWVLDAHSSALSFGLRLPGITLPPAPGHAQRELCLEALALFHDGQP